MKKPIYIIEHLEPELFEWCLIEYEHISELVGKDNLWFTNLKTEDNKKKLSSFGKTFSESVSKLKLSNACVLDPQSDKTLSPSDNFEYYLFGGILGDHPPKKRTKEELTKFVAHFETRDIGKEQMSTDNAVYTVKQIAENGKKLGELKFVDNVSIELNEFESIELPYRYNLFFESGEEKPFISPKIKQYLIKKQGF